MLNNVLNQVLPQIHGVTEKHVHLLHFIGHFCGLTMYIYIPLLLTKTLFYIKFLLKELINLINRSKLSKYFELAGHYIPTPYQKLMLQLCSLHNFFECLLIKENEAFVELYVFFYTLSCTFDHFPIKIICWNIQDTHFISKLTCLFHENT